MNNLGKPNFFDIDKYLDCVEGMILADEVERAFCMISNPPAWYRDNEPERLKEIRQSLHQAMFTPVEYAQADREIDGPGTAWPDRAEILNELANKIKGTFHIMELGPGSHWLSHGLMSRGHKFTYESRSLNAIMRAPVDGPGPNIFVAYELIEHLQNENELFQGYLKFGKKAQFICISTPLYTFSGGMNQWRGQALGHLRAYTPKEFSRVVTSMFEGYDWKQYLNADCTQVLVGERV